LTDSCLVCGARRMYIESSRGVLVPAMLEDHKKAPEIESMIADEKIAKQQEERERRVTVAAVLTKKKGRKKTGGLV